MLFDKEIEAMNIAFDFSRRYTVARVPKSYDSAEEFAIKCVYSLRPYVADKIGVDSYDVVLIAISENGKVVVFCEEDRYRRYLYPHFQRPSCGAAQFYDDVDPELIIETMNVLFPSR